MKPQTRIDIIDGLKAIAMQIIVLHHLASYGPLADAAGTALPHIVGWLYDHGRYAVQVFLVIGGYLAARVLSPEGKAASESLLATLLNRYLRLVLPYSVALLFAIVCAAYARDWIEDADFIPAAPTLAQWLAHVFLMQDVLGHEALTTGVWYVAIDFQLFALLAVLTRLAPRTGLIITTLISIAAMFWFNRDESLDAWAVYFFGAYGLGAVAYRAHHGDAFALRCQRWLWLAAGIALLLDFRWRLLLALATAVMLHVSLRTSPLSGPTRFQLPSLVVMLGRTSYALFLIHFPVYMLVSAMFERNGWLDGSPWHGVAGMGATWLLSLAAAILMHRWIERPSSRLRIGGWATSATR